MLIPVTDYSTGLIFTYSNSRAVSDLQQQRLYFSTTYTNDSLFAWATTTKPGFKKMWAR
jgi:hypothetical protein